MKRVFLILLIFTFSLLGFSQKIELEGTYQGKNIYVQNPLAVASKDFCTEKVLVNGKEVYFEKASSFVILLDSLNLTRGDSLKVEIFHKEDCRPKILSDNSSPKSTFILDSISINTSGILYWKSKNEIGKLPFIVEQFKWNRWIKVGELDSKGDGGNDYTIAIPAHSGENKVRIKQQDAFGLLRLSKTIAYNNDAKKVILKIQRLSITSSILEFDKETMYEIYDQWGNVVKKGTGIKVDCTSLPRGSYYVNYDNEMGEFVKY